MKKDNLIISHPSIPSFEMIFVEGGPFSVGSEEYANERPIHQVRISSFYLGKYQVTQQLWQAIMRENPARFQGPDRPVEMVSWEDAQEFIQQLNKETGKSFRLPREAEWEYAARGGQHSQGYLYCGSDKLKQVGWYDDNSSGETHEVGSLRPNELGLYDMSGNVWEWCEDWYDQEYYQKCQEQGLVEDPTNLSGGTVRVLRGGSYFDGPVHCRPTDRGGNTPERRSGGIGFRLVLPFQSVG